MQETYVDTGVIKMGKTLESRLQETLGSVRWSECLVFIVAFLAGWLVAVLSRWQHGFTVSGTVTGCLLISVYLTARGWLDTRHLSSTTVTRPVFLIVMALLITGASLLPKDGDGITCQMFQELLGGMRLYLYGATLHYFIVERSKALLPTIERKTIEEPVVLALLFVWIIYGISTLSALYTVVNIWNSAHPYLLSRG